MDMHLISACLIARRVTQQASVDSLAGLRWLLVVGCCASQKDCCCTPRSNSTDPRAEAVVYDRVLPANVASPVTGASDLTMGCCIQQYPDSRAGR